ncbi:MAG: FxsA family protein [Actinobacteria bacterium]|nr:FxsA family protein [Actinomycetota bacterium]
MSFRSRLLVFGYPLLEVATAYAVALWIGWGWMLLLVLAGFPIGFAIMRHAGNGAVRDIQQVSATGREPDSRHALTFVGGVLVAIPGFWSDLVGLLLVIPPTQRLFRQSARTWLSSRITMVRMPGVHYPGGDIIQGTVIPNEPGPSNRPDTGPREIV